MSYRAEKQVIDTHTRIHGQTQTQAMTIPESQNWTRVKMLRFVCVSNFQLTRFPMIEISAFQWSDMKMTKIAILRVALTGKHGPHDGQIILHCNKLHFLNDRSRKGGMNLNCMPCLHLYQALRFLITLGTFITRCPLQCFAYLISTKTRMRMGVTLYLCIDIPTT